MTKKNEPVYAIIRHHMSGVWIARIDGPSPLLGDAGLLMEGRRIRSWSGGRVDCSDLAEQGCRPADTLTTRRVVHLALESMVEVHPIDPALWTAAMEL